MRDALKPIIKNHVQEAIESEGYKDLEKIYAESTLDLILTTDDRRMYLFKVVFGQIRNKDDDIKIERLIQEADVRQLIKKC